MSHRVRSARWVSAFALTLVMMSCGGTPTETVPPPPPPSPQPPPPPAPTASLKIAPGNILLGDSFNAKLFCGGTSATITSPWGTNTVTTEGDAWLTPTSVGNIEYTYSCTGAGGTTTVKSVVVVEPVPPVGARTTRNRPDEASGLQAQLVYITTKNGIDRELDTNGAIKSAWTASQNWLAIRTGMVERMDTYRGEDDILYFRSSYTNADLLTRNFGSPLGNLHQEMVDSGLIKPGKRYLAYAEINSPISCGAAMVVGVAVVYLQAVIVPSGIKCGGDWEASPSELSSYWAVVMLHESFHLGGAVDQKAPDFCSGAHLSDPQELMGGCNGWSPSVIDPLGRNYFGDSVPVGVVNFKKDPILTPAPASLMALKIQAPKEEPRMVNIPIPH